MEVSSSALQQYLFDDLYGHGRLPPQGADDYWPGATVTDVQKLRLARSLLKKSTDDIKPDADFRCLQKFLASDKRCFGWRYDPQTSLEEILMNEFRNSVVSFLEPRGEPLVQSTMDLAIRGRPGPGASLGATAENLYNKLFASRLSATSPEVYAQYIEYIMWFPGFADAEISRLLRFGLPRYTSSSQLSFVRKTRDISRSICTEPSLNMWFQLGLGEIIGDRLKSYFGIDLSDQPEKNRTLAYRGSLDDSISTIDLESASDSVSLALCEWCLPGWFLDLLYRYRTPKTKIGDVEVTLHMVSTMGNGFTFPLQTMLFACVVTAVARVYNVRLGPHNFGVFGDDIIVPVEIDRPVRRLLSLLGFVVNDSKSYSVGPFRESCGADFYLGVNVRGVYLKTLLTQESRYTAINLLNEWTARTGIPLARTVGYLQDSVRNLAVPLSSPVDSGVRMHIPPPGSYLVGKQRYLYRYRTVVTPVITVDHAFRLLRFPHGRKRPKGSAHYNPHGLWESFLHGSVYSTYRKRSPSDCISLRLRQGEFPKYRTAVGFCPHWGPDSMQVRLAADPEFWLRLNAAIETNLRLDT